MSSTSPQKILAFKADGAIAKGSAVKIGSDKEHVAKCTANTDASIGIAQNSVTTAEDCVEVAIAGGGAKALAKETIAAGKLLVPNADGSLEQTNASGDRVIAVAMESAVAGDLFAVEVQVAVATAANQ
jgi:hypothetical protein